MYLARKALEPYKEYMKTATFHNSEGCVTYPIDSFPYPTSSFKYRVDAEASSESGLDFETFIYGDGVLPPDVVDALFDQIECDTEDFIIFADTEKETEGRYSLKYPFDGVIKRQNVPINIDLLTARTYKEYKRMKDCFEFTTYIRLNIEWGPVL